MRTKGLLMDEHDYGRRVAELRGHAGMTQSEFAKLYGIPLRTLQDIEAGNVTRPQHKTRKAIDDARAAIEGALGLSTREETEQKWPVNVQAFLNTLGAFLVNTMPESERDAWIMKETQRIFEEFGQRRRRQ